MCIDVLLKQAKDGAFVSVRSLEFGDNLDSGGIVRSPGTVMRSLGPDFLPGGLEWKIKYGYVGLEAFHHLVANHELLHDLQFTIDGINSEGVSCGALWLLGSQYQSEAGERSHALLSLLFVDWVLGMCKDVGEVRKALQNGDIWVWGGDFIEQHVPLHFSIHDRRGGSIVVEFSHGIACVYNNTVGVCTNLPEFPWHLTNVRNYIDISPDNPQAMDIEGFHAEPLGQGQGTRGLPGGYSPPSRFIRILMLKHFAEQPLDAREARTQALHLLNNTDLIKGTAVGTNTWGNTENDHNQVTTIRDLTNRRFYLHTYDNLQTRVVDLKKVDFTMPGTRAFSIGYDVEAIDITSRTNMMNVMAA